jgi:hypothetical protein
MKLPSWQMNYKTQLRASPFKLGDYPKKGLPSGQAFFYRHRELNKDNFSKFTLADLIYA